MESEVKRPLLLWVLVILCSLISGLCLGVLARLMIGGDFSFQAFLGMLVLAGMFAFLANGLYRYREGARIAIMILFLINIFVSLAELIKPNLDAGVLPIIVVAMKVVLSAMAFYLLRKRRIASLFEG